MMLLENKIYGQAEIIEPVLLELLNSPDMERLKGICQYGGGFITKYPYPGFSRYEHSIGVMMVLKKLGASLDEQIAGLTHDVSHTAFSHVIDYVLGSLENEDFQDGIHESFLEKSEVGKILNKYGYDPKEIADVKKYNLLEKELPNVCADRIDYSLQEFDLWANPQLVSKVLSSITVVEQRIVFKNFEVARDFANTFLKLQTEHWGSFETVNRFFRLAEILRKSLERKIITNADLFFDDEYVLNKIYKSQEQDIIEEIDKMKKKTVWDKLGKTIKKKFRYIDPEILIDNGLHKLTEVDKVFFKELECQKELNAQGIEI